MKKLVVVFFIVMILLTTIIDFADSVFSNQNEVKYEDYAEKLKEIGVFKGTGSGFELDREPTRIEAAAMFVRLLGAEQEANEQNYEHPFTDVQDWGSPYVGYLYYNKLTNGVGATTFGANNNIQAKSYMTFILRALGYDDSKGEFSWNESLEFAKDKSVIDEEDLIELNTHTFLRDHVAKYSYLALKMSLKESETTLIDKLVNLEVIDKNIAEEIGLMNDIITEPKDESKGNTEKTVEELMSPRDFTDAEIKELRELAEGDVHNWLVDDGRYGEVINDINEVFDTDILKLIDNAIFLSDDKLYFLYDVGVYGKIGIFRVAFPDGAVRQQVISVFCTQQYHTQKYERIYLEPLEYTDIITIKSADKK